MVGFTTFLLLLIVTHSLLGDSDAWPNWDTLMNLKLPSILVIKDGKRKSQEAGRRLVFNLQIPYIPE